MKANAMKMDAKPSEDIDKNQSKASNHKANTRVLQFKNRNSYIPKSLFPESNY